MQLIGGVFARARGVRRRSALGNVMWQKAFGSAGNDHVQGITADAEGNIFLVGSFDGPVIDLGAPALLNADTKGLSTTDVFVGWLDGNGTARV